MTGVDEIPVAPVLDYPGFTARLEHLAPSDTDPAQVAGLQQET